MLKSAVPSCGNIIPLVKTAPYAIAYMAQIIRLCLTNLDPNCVSNAMRQKLPVVAEHTLATCWIMTRQILNARDSKLD